MRIVLFVSRSGRSPIRSFVDGLPVALRVGVFRALELIEEHGLKAPGVSFRQIKGKLWEIRVSMEKYLPDLYFCRTAEEIVLLHAYRKQTRKAPAREIEVAERRMFDVLNR